MPRKTGGGLQVRQPLRGRFNEAAARCRGKLSDAGRSGDRRGCFNEAAARCRGKREILPRVGRISHRFNEAAARCRGKRADDVRRALAARASMRPRPDATENASEALLTVARKNALQ